MFRIKGKSISNRVATSRTGMRARRLPSIVLRSGEVIRIHPNRQVFISEPDLRANKESLLKMVNSITVTEGKPPFAALDLGTLFTSEPEVIVEPNQLPKRKPRRKPEVVSETEPEVVSETESEVVSETEPEVISEPELEVKPKKPTRRRRRSKKSDD